MHTPVLLNEVIHHLKPTLLTAHARPVILDATFGYGGYTRRLLQEFPVAARVLAVDRDPTAYQRAHQLSLTEPRVLPVHSRFSRLSTVIRRLHEQGKLEAPQLQAAVFDLGVSSMQLDQGDRGFSYHHDAPLDMRMDPRTDADSPTAADIINHSPEKHLAEILRRYSDEKYASGIVRAIVAARQRRPIETTHQLVTVIRQAVPYDKNKHVARRTFQALRMAVNQELEEIDRGISAAIRHLVPGGRLLCVAFHSIEAEAVERTVQPFVQRHELQRIAGPIHATASEVEANRRSRSAVLTVFERT